MFKVIKAEPTPPKTQHMTIRLPIRQLKVIEEMAKDNDVSVSQVVIQMIDYCINSK